MATGVLTRGVVVGWLTDFCWGASPCSKKNILYTVLAKSGKLDVLSINQLNHHGFCLALFTLNFGFLGISPLLTSIVEAFR